MMQDCWGFVVISGTQAKKDHKTKNVILIAKLYASIENDENTI